ncbi:alpha/beta hydrolase family protein [Acrocarpospora corrugata]|uniref:alpha/beta hydrolase family protein n=1 Tax=Acrocarpospora corrugata TaxID=35763 RepID=UPI00147932E2|nr:alpha/beta hydrolase [Acrocarpospora corrugata]
MPADGPRQLMVSLWYPATAKKGTTARYVTPEESALILRGVPGGENHPPDTIAKTRTHARVGAPPSRRSLPLVVMSPGFTFPRATLTALGEDLDSRGYLVAAVEHTYESVATTFPDGRTTTCVVCRQQQTDELGARVAKVRVADISFVLDHLLKRAPLGLRIGKIAMVGHSMGGNSAAHTMAADQRVRVGVNLDGTFLPEAPTLTRPFMMFGTTTGHSPGGRDTSWDSAWPHLKGANQWLTVTGADHSSFTDPPSLTMRSSANRSASPPRPSPAPAQSKSPAPTWRPSSTATYATSTDPPQTSPKSYVIQGDSCSSRLVCQRRRG